MKHEIIAPPPHLEDYVRMFWFLEFDSPECGPFVHHAFAHHCCEFIFCYKGQFVYESASDGKKKMITGIFGQTQTLSKVTSGPNFGVFGFYLYPYALTQLFNLPAKEITNQSIDLKTLFGREGEILEEKILLTSDNDQRIKIVIEFLEKRLKNIRNEFLALCSSLKTFSTGYSGIDIKNWASDNCLSVRQFERRIQELSGFSPKQFLRIARFNALLNKTFKEKCLAEIAFEFGYYDESHFNHDFKQFSGINPREYFRPETIAATDRGTVSLSF
ncbi:MAG: helix-turn-helix domain-containing protein [Spirosomataceae bacterium]